MGCVEERNDAAKNGWSEGVEGKILGRSEAVEVHGVVHGVQGENSVVTKEL